MGEKKGEANKYDKQPGIAWVNSKGELMKINESFKILFEHKILTGVNRKGTGIRELFFKGQQLSRLLEDLKNNKCEGKTYSLSLNTRPNIKSNIWVYSVPMAENSVYTIMVDLLPEDKGNSKNHQAYKSFAEFNYLKNIKGEYLSASQSFLQLAMAPSIKELNTMVDRDDLPTIIQKLKLTDEKLIDYILQEHRYYTNSYFEKETVNNYVISRYPIVGDDGNFHALLVAGSYYSDIAFSEDQLGEKNSKYDLHFRSLLHNSSDAISIIDKDGRIIFESSLRNRINDYLIEDLIGERFEDLVHFEDVKIFNQVIDYLKENPENEFKKEYRLKHKNKKWVYVESIFSNQISNPYIKGIVINTRDISDRKMAELKERVYYDNLLFLSKSALDLFQFSEKDDVFNYIAERLNEYLADSIIIVAEYDKEHKDFVVRHIRGQNESGEKIKEILGFDAIGERYSAQHVLNNIENFGKISIFKGELNEADLGNVKKQYLEKAYNSLNINKIYNISLTKEKSLFGNVSILTLNKSIIKFKHIIETFIYQVSMVLHRSQLESELMNEKFKAEESDKLKTAFLANMSHEIRTPMNGILGFSEMLNESDLSSSLRKKYVDIINSNGKLLLNLIDDIIDFSKIEASQIKLVYQDFSLNSLLNQIHAFFDSENLKKEHTSVELRLKKQKKEEESYIRTDPTRVRQVLTNLISNAVKFTPTGYIEFGYTIRNNETIEFYVKDTGIGIRSEKIDKIFERFVQADYSSTRKFGGSGLGLAISKGFVELLGGTMWVRSEVGKGSVFYFSIPYVPAKKYEHETKEREPKRKSFNWENKCFLIAEDDKFSYKLLEGLLKKTKVKVLHAEDGIKAIEQFEKNLKVDLILMDVQMPNLNGLEATAAIKKMDPSIPIIAQTANAIIEERQKCFEAGVDDFVTKPININELFNKIDGLLSGKPKDKKK